MERRRRRRKRSEKWVTIWRYSVHSTAGLWPLTLKTNSLPDRSDWRLFLQYESSLIWAGLAIIRPVQHSWMETKPRTTVLQTSSGQKKQQQTLWGAGLSVDERANWGWCETALYIIYKVYSHCPVHSRIYMSETSLLWLFTQWVGK